MRTATWTWSRAIACAALLFTVNCGDEAVVETSGGGGNPPSGCPAGMTECGGACVDTATDLDHCGACDSPCAPGELCDGAGHCAANCQAGLSECAGLCVDTATHNAHCGGCDLACDPGEICDGAGSCALSCQASLVACDGTCIDPLDDESHCGAGPDCAAEPGVACGPGEICDGSGTCALSCQQGLVECAGKCIDPLTDRIFCGAGPDCTTNPGTACGPGQLCDGSGNCALSCQPGLIDCAGTCIDPDTDNQHCGAGPDCTVDPGVACTGGTVCNGSGVCATNCQPPLVACNQTCVDPWFDGQHCGAGPNCSPPGTVCPPGHVCDGMGFCALSCQAGLLNCSTACVDPQTDNAHCGGCNIGCAPGEICSGGLCQLSCQAGLVDCNDSCVDPLSDEGHCGAGPDCSVSPGIACPSGTICTGGTCLPNCPSGYVPCAGSCIDPSTTVCPCSNPADLLCGGNCTDPLTDPQYCGATGDCTGPNAGTACALGEVCEGGACCPDCGGNGCCGSGQICSAGACIKPLVNGSFESGLTGWIAQDMMMPFFPLGVAPAGTPTPYGAWNVTPTDGSFALLHGFDGQGPGEISVAQDVTVPTASTVMLQFDYRASWDNFGMSARTFVVQVEPSGGGAPLQNATVLTAPPMTSLIDTGPLTGQVDLTPFAGQAIRIRFVWFIPEFFTGPGSFQLDQVQLF